MNSRRFKSRFLRFAPALASAVMLGGMAMKMRASAPVEDAAPYHKQVAGLLGDLPAVIGEWEGAKITVPLPAVKLLRPNVIQAWHYQNSRTRRWANLVAVHCKDSRDMFGHFPPNCYPSSGWTQVRPPEQVELRVGARTIPMMQYNFKRNDLGRVENHLIFNFFVLPSGIVRTMEEVQDATRYHRDRGFGAAQFQIVMDAATPENRRDEVVRDLLQPLIVAIEVLQVHKQGDPK